MLPSYCICSDPQCPAEEHVQRTCGEPASALLVRMDMEPDPNNMDAMPFCESCAADALASGVFAEAD